MRNVALGITATVVLLAVTALLVAVAVWGPRGPMNHGWDWPWHDWWHSRWEHSRLHQDVPHATNAHKSWSGRTVRQLLAPPRHILRNRLQFG